MRQVLGTTRKLTILFLAGFALMQPWSASADDIINQNAGFSLPGVQLPQGSDEVRASDGTSCRSAVGGTGAYLDVGVIGNPQSEAKRGSYYGRIVVPLGRSPTRLDCAKLYELEVERLRMELRLMQAGLGRSEDPEADDTQTSSVEDDGEAVAMEAVVVDAPKPAKKKKKKSSKSNWDTEGWSQDGLAAEN